MSTKKTCADQTWVRNITSIIVVSVIIHAIAYRNREMSQINNGYGLSVAQLGSSFKKNKNH